MLSIRGLFPSVPLPLSQESSAHSTVRSLGGATYISPKLNLFKAACVPPVLHYK